MRLSPAAISYIEGIISDPQFLTFNRKGGVVHINDTQSSGTLLCGENFQYGYLIIPSSEMTLCLTCEMVLARWRRQIEKGLTPWPFDEPPLEILDADKWKEGS